MPILADAPRCHRGYQSECADQRVQERQCVLVHWWRHTGQIPPVSNVFHECPQLQDQRSFLLGDQPHNGHLMRGPDGPRLFRWSGSRSRTADDLAGLCRRAHMPQYYDLVRMHGDFRLIGHPLERPTTSTDARLGPCARMFCRFAMNIFGQWSLA
jgi:hypothetical protein